MKAATSLLALFVVLTIVFASISVFEFVQLGNQKAQSNLTTTIGPIITQSNTSQTQTSGSSPFPDNGCIQIGSVGYFHYMKIQGSGGEPTLNTSLENVAFTYLKPNATTTGGICYDFRVTFQDASSENLKACSFPTNFETSVTFSRHAKPTTGLMLISGASIYAMVSM